MNVLLVYSSNNTRVYKPRLFTRLPEYMVGNRIVGFINENNIDNCYQFLEGPNHLLLKCWGMVFGKKQLFEVNIIVQKEYLNKIDYF